MSEQQLKVDETVALFIVIRDAIKKMDDAHAAKVKPYKDQLDQLKGLLQEHLDKTGADSVKTKSGTAISSLKYGVSIADKQMFKDYVIQTERWELLDWKANNTAAVDYAKENNTPPPGVNISPFKDVGVRRPTNSASD